MLEQWNEILKRPDYWERSPERRALIKSGWFETYVVPTPEFQAYDASDQKILTDHFNKPEEFVGYDRGMVDDILSRAARGGLRLVESVGGALRMADLDPTQDTGILGRAGRAVTDYAEGAEQKYDVFKPDIAEARGEEGFLKRGLTGAVESIAPSLAPLAGGILTGAAVGSVVPGIGTTIGGVVGGLATLFATFGLGNYQTTYDETIQELKNQGITGEEAERRAKKNALISATAEAGGEFAGDLAALTFFGVLGKRAISQSLKRTIKELLGGGKKNFAKALAKTAPFEVGSEMGTAYFQAKAAQEAGISDITPGEAISEAVLPAIILSAIFGGAVHTMNSVRARQLYSDLNSEVPEQRIAAVQEVAGRMKDKEEQRVWLDTAQAYIQAGESIPISQPIVDFAVQKTDQELTPEPTAKEETDAVLADIGAAQTPDEAIDAFNRGAAARSAKSAEAAEGLRTQLEEEEAAGPETEGAGILARGKELDQTFRIQEDKFFNRIANETEKYGAELTDEAIRSFQQEGAQMGLDPERVNQSIIDGMSGKTPESVPEAQPGGTGLLYSGMEERQPGAAPARIIPTTNIPEGTGPSEGSLERQLAIEKATITPEELARQNQEILDRTMAEEVEAIRAKEAEAEPYTPEATPSELSLKNQEILEKEMADQAQEAEKEAVEPEPVPGVEVEKEEVKEAAKEPEREATEDTERFPQSYVDEVLRDKDIQSLIESRHEGFEEVLGEKLSHDQVESLMVEMMQQGKEQGNMFLISDSHPKQPEWFIKNAWSAVQPEPEPESTVKAEVEKAKAKAAEKKEAEEAKKAKQEADEAKTADTPIGKNDEGVNIYEDAKGIRYIIEGAFRSTEPVAIIPGQLETPPTRKSPTFLTEEERAALATPEPEPKPAAKDLTPGQKRISAILEDDDKALAVDEAIKKGKHDLWEESEVKQRVLKNVIFNAVDRNRDQVEPIFKIVQEEPEYASREEKPEKTPIAQEVEQVKDQAQAKEPEGEPSPYRRKIGRTGPIMGVQATLVDAREIDGVRYELYNAEDVDAGFVRIYDVDSGNVVTMTRYTNYYTARNKWAEAIQKVSETEVKDTPEEKPSVADEVKQLKEKPIAAYVLAATKVANQVWEALDRGKWITAKDLFTWADKAFGGTQGEGKYTSKDAYDAMELGVNQHIAAKTTAGFPVYDPLEPTADGAKNIVNFLKGMLGKLPTQTKRTAEQDEFQQFSTPPSLAYMANWAANLNENDVYLEPSAGIGGLAVFGQVAEVQEIIVNELSERRAALIKEMGFDFVYSEKGEQINNILPVGVKPTVVVMNPPFSATAGRMQGKRQTEEGIRHVEQALARLEPNGRLVAIVGAALMREQSETATDTRMTPTKKALDWWKKIESEYDVKAVVNMSGKEYTKYGTSFDNVLMVIDKAGPTEDVSQIVTGGVDKIEDLIPLLEDVRNARTTEGKQGISEPGEPEVTEEGETEPGPGPTVLPAVSDVGAGKPETGIREPGPTGEPGTITEPVGAEGSDQVSDQERPGRPDQPAEGIKPEGPGSDISSDTGTGTPEPDSDASGILSAAEVRVKDKADAEEVLDEGLYEGYTPERLDIPGSKKHPTPLVQSAAMAAVTPPEADYSPKIPKKAITSGKLSDIQMEAVVYAGRAHEQMLPDGKTRKGYFIGDGTGVGKGREIAAVLWDNWNQGRKKGVWISEKQPLFSSAQRDMDGAGWNSDLIFKHQKTKALADIKEKNGILYTTYSTLASGSQQQNTQSRLDQIVNWLGEDFDGVIAFDESHNMGNAVAVRGDRGTTRPAAKALAGVDLQARLPNARILYVSATGATEVINLAYADRLGLWGEGTAFPDKIDFVNKIAGSGVAAMEMVAMNMKSMGAYTARSLSYNGVEYDRLEHTLSADQVSDYDKLAEGWQVVLQNINNALAVTGIIDDHTGATNNGQALGRALGQFWGAHQRFFNQVITSMQMPTVLKKIQEDLDAGHAVVIQLTNTMEASQERAFAKLSEDDTLEDLDMSPMDILMQYIDRSFPTTQFEDYVDDNGNIQTRPVQDSQGNFVQNQEAMRMKEQLMDELGSLRRSVVDAPLDQLVNEFGPDMIAEITGRKRRVVDIPGKGLVEEKKRGAAKLAAEVKEFKEDKRRILVFSEKGGTGESYHADKDDVNQRIREHYLLQAGWRADKAVQGLGRTHRSNQKQPPHYYLVTTNLEGQKRFLSSVARRLDQLGALTKGSRETGSQGIFQAKDNLESEYASDALRNFFEDLHRDTIPGLSMADFLEQTGLKSKVLDDFGNLKADLPNTRTFLNRLLSMNVSSMNETFNAFSERIDEIVEAHAEAGTLDVGMETLKGDSINKASEEVVHTDEQTGAETKYVQFDVTVPARIFDFESASNYGKAFYRNVKSGNIWADNVRSVTNRRAGTTRMMHVLRSPTYGEQRLEDLDSEKWEKLSKKEAKKSWNEAVDDAPKTVDFKEHLVTGNILPIWDRLIGNPRIMRVQTDQGERMIGRIITSRDLNDTLRNLGAAATQVKMEPAEIWSRVLKQGYRVELANQWRIERRKVSGENRIEIKGISYRDFPIYEKYGVFSERISYETRYFIPNTEEGIETIKAIIKNAPIVSAEPPSRGQYSTAPTGPETLANLTPEDVKDIFKGQEVNIMDDGTIVIHTKGDQWLGISEVNELIPDEAAFEINWGKGWTKDQKIAGGYDPGGPLENSGTIRLTKGLGTNRYVLRHEQVHWLEDVGILSTRDIELLRSQIKKEAKAGTWTPKNPQDIGGEEDRAWWISRQLEGVPGEQPGKIVTRIMDRVKTWIDQMVNLFRRSASGVARDIESGKIYEREAGEGGLLDGERYQVSAFHGSPHEIADKFRTDKIGTGEGVQAFGWGLYFTEKEDIARWYADKLGKSGRLRIGSVDLLDAWNEAPSETMNHWSNVADRASRLHLIKRDIENYKGSANRNPSSPWDKDYMRLLSEQQEETFEQLKEILKDLALATDPNDYPSQNQTIKKIEKALTSPEDVTEERGRNLYKVILHEGKEAGDYLWLDWEKTMGNQSSGVKEALKGALKERGFTDEQITNILSSEPGAWQVKDPETGMSRYVFTFGEMKVLERQGWEILEAPEHVRPDTQTGEQVYHSIESFFGAKEASLLLLKHGIDGNRYPSGSLSGAKGDAYNYVVFDESAVTIEKHERYTPADEIDPAFKYTEMKEPPVKTVKAYKLFRTLKTRPGEIFPLFIGNQQSTPLNKWIEAEFIPTKGYADRPGWHSGMLPSAPHLMKKDGSMAEGRVWAEIEIPDDVDWQSEADSSKTQDIRDKVPEGGFYRFKVPARQGVEWRISGAIKVNKLLTDREVSDIIGDDTGQRERYTTALAIPGTKQPRSTYADTLAPVTEQDYIDNRAQKGNLKLRAETSIARVTGEIKEGADKFVGASSTRLGKVSQKLKAKVRRLDIDISMKSQKDIDAVLPMLRKAKKSMSKAEYQDWDYARKNSDTAKINELIKKHKLEKEYRAYREQLDKLRAEAIDVGLDIGFIEDYSPRVLKDSRGFLTAIQKGTEWPIYTRKIKERAAELDISVDEMTQDQKAMIISNMILGGYSGLGGIPASKDRKLKKIPPDLVRYYMDSDSALMAHIHTMRKGIEARKFFGKIPERVAKIRTQLHATQTRLRDVEKQLRDPNLTDEDREKLEDKKNVLFGNTQEYWAYMDMYAQQRDYKDNISVYIGELIDAGEIQPEQERIVNDILNARFHEKGTSGIWSFYKNFSYADTMGSPISALTQIGDSAWAAYDSGLWRLAKNIPRSMVGRQRISKEDIGMTRIAQEFDDSGTMAKAVSKIFKYVGLEKIDAIGKEALINGSFQKYKAEARKDPAKLRKKLEPIFQGETDDVINDLLEDKVTENVKVLVYSRVLDFQPMALSEMPEGYLSAGNGRLFYMLKTFTIKQFDVYRNEIFMKLQTGNKADKAQAMKNFVRLTMFFVAANAGADEIKDWVLGRKTDFEDRTVDNVLRLFGVSKYITWQARREGIGTALAKQILPPFKFANALTKDALHLSEREPQDLEVVGSIPLLGKLAYWHMGRGVEKRDDIWDVRLRREKRNLKDVYDRYQGAKDRPGFRSRHRKEIQRYKQANSLQGQLNIYKRRINNLSKQEGSPAIDKQIERLKERRKALIKRFLKK